MMLFGLWIKVAFMIFVALVAVGLLYWGWRHGQFRNPEEPKFRMLEDREPEPWPDRKGGKQ